jgi:dTDP-4-dehydrorhamnose 3,5-epimerase
MIFSHTPIQGSFLIDIEPRSDERGMFARVFCRREFDAIGITTDFVQANVSICAKRGTIRGLHWQKAPHGEPKLFRCTRGEIFEASVDLRPESPTYRQWFGIRLDAYNHRMLFVPAGCANGYQALTDDAEVTYFAGAFYTPEAERGMRWNDPSFMIDWPVLDGVIVSPKDASWPDYPVDNSPQSSVA